MTVSIIVAMSQNRVIGKEQKLPWHLPADLKRFKKITSGHPVIMGRKTYDSMGKPLPHRTNIVVSRNQNLVIPGVKVVKSIEDGLIPYKNSAEEVFILGGGEIFAQALDIVDKCYLTIIHQEIEGDTFFPDQDLKAFELVFEEHHSEPLPFSFLDYSRK